MWHSNNCSKFPSRRGLAWTAIVIYQSLISLCSFACQLRELLGPARSASTFARSHWPGSVSSTQSLAARASTPASSVSSSAPSFCCCGTDTPGSAAASSRCCLIALGQTRCGEYPESSLTIFAGLAGLSWARYERACLYWCRSVERLGSIPSARSCSPVNTTEFACKSGRTMGCYSLESQLDSVREKLQSRSSWSDCCHR